MSTQIMLDLETFGTRPGSVIVAIGAVIFSDRGIEDEFYARICPKSAVAIGLEMDPETVQWWLKQPEAARLEVARKAQPGEHICDVLCRFSRWLPLEGKEMWGNGAAFDNALLAEAYYRARNLVPWKFSEDRCYRTVKNLFPQVLMKREGVYHNALDDARSQALHLMEILSVMGGSAELSDSRPL